MTDDCTPQSPTVYKLSWGKMQVGERVYKDCKLWPGGSREWNWNETGTKHSPGVQRDDIEEILSKGDIHTLIISRGMQGVLQVPKATVDYAKEHGAEVHVCLTKEAVKMYNNLAKEGTKVGGIFHSTC